MLKKGRNVNIRTLVGRKIAQLQRFHALVFKILSTAIIHLKEIIFYVCKQRHQLKLSSFISVHKDVFSLGNKSTSCGEFLCCWYFSLLLHLIESSYYLDNFLQMKLTWPVNIRRTHTVYCAFIATSRRQISCRWQLSTSYVILWKSFSSRSQLGQTLNKYPLIYILSIFIDQLVAPIPDQTIHQIMMLSQRIAWDCITNVFMFIHVSLIPCSLVPNYLDH